MEETISIPWSPTSRTVSNVRSSGSWCLSMSQLIVIPLIVSFIYIALPSMIQSLFCSQCSTQPMTSFLFSLLACPFGLYFTIQPVHQLFPCLFSFRTYMCSGGILLTVMMTTSVVANERWTSATTLDWLNGWMLLWSGLLWPSILSYYHVKEHHIWLGPPSPSVEEFRQASAEWIATTAQQTTTTTKIYVQHQHEQSHLHYDSQYQIIIHPDTNAKTFIPTSAASTNNQLPHELRRQSMLFFQTFCGACCQCPCQASSVSPRSWSYSPWMCIWSVWLWGHQVWRIATATLSDGTIETSSSSLEIWIDVSIFLFCFAMCHVWVIAVEQWFPWIFHFSYLLLYITLGPTFLYYFHQHIWMGWIRDLPFVWLQLMAIESITSCFTTLLQYVVVKMTAPYLYTEWMFLGQLMNYVYEFFLFGFSSFAIENCVCLIVFHLHTMFQLLGYYSQWLERDCCHYHFVNESKHLVQLLQVLSRSRLFVQDEIAYLLCLLCVPVLFFTCRSLLVDSDLQWYLQQQVQPTTFWIQILFLLILRLVFAWATWILLQRQFYACLLLPHHSYSDQLHQYLIRQLHIPQYQLYHYEQWYQQEYPSLFDPHVTSTLFPQVTVVQTLPTTLSLRSFLPLQSSHMLYFGWVTGYVLSNLYQYYHLERPPFL